ncbi:hypothetical protein [Leptolyngbya sp. FACHB-261]|uniref:hypothetical protein n=1 Tax=Leptolyngbya sp. FACHB-261 TaxID=2692806 RepID=UPI00168282B0|nr:hypothetical protein [Leptolyngbya sp. FACHB-261]MBD2103369.1 hypothetical protein [Leptolyngbya sp. FACHB-261]
MVDTVKAPALSAESRLKKHVKLSDINYRRNTESDFTEKIEALDRNFDYQSNSEHYWGEPELSLLYGTPLYEEASPSQRLALNHLYWATQYNQTAATEANAVLYNQVTAGVFSAVGGYDSLCKELDLETDQERDHIHAFHTIGYKTKRALLGKSGFNASIQGKGSQLAKKSSAKPGSGQRSQLFSFGWNSSPLSTFQDYAFRFVTNNVFLRNQAHCYSEYLRDLEHKGEAIPAQTTGLMGHLGPRPVLQFFTLNCGSSPFLACVFYVARFMANMLIKNYEYRYSHYYKELERRGEFIPAPIAVSHFHLMDEAFHTTTSQLISQELYRDFPKPSAYEKLVANLTIYRAQSVGLSGLSGGLPAIFRNDSDFMLSFYQLLQSPVFGMSPEESLQWVEKSLCHENEGFHVTYKYHQRLLAELRRMFEDIEYLWPVNREMRLMAGGGSIEKALQNNIKSFEQFSRSVA